MDAASIKRLNDLNRAFYALTVTDFDESRGRPWPGWRRLLPHLAGKPSPVRVLDVGCGNGRFGRFLARNVAAEVRYHGLDFSPALLDAARDAFARMGILADAVLEACDVLADGLPDGVYDLVAAFGLLHHVPGGENRRALVRALAERLAPGGLLVFTGWRFYEYERFRERIEPWPDGVAREPGDFLLDWRRGHAANTALRYCHHIDDAEQDALIAASGLERVETFRADGHTGDINSYALLRTRQASSLRRVS
ncbi:MAG: class I SAM-dependent methyltransferase [Anaerolineae bacterium]|nr:class I SAM-dependent methyltransferase [Anaerolineae bacterium]